uniref:Splicing coactivator subunit-like protein n=1 Tax=Oryza sativa subsp. japonica TaxID=39947 RepID=Q6ZFQ9_ORYSJ|nr:splicing coactivator subunit-like protein [Oryza sativa Japonica Group]
MSIDPDFVHLHPCTFVYNQTEPQTKPYPLDMWKVNKPRGRGARTGSTGVGPTRQPHGPRWTGRTRLAPVGAVGPTRQPHPRARAADGRAPRGSHSARTRAATPARSAGGGAPVPRWSPPATTGAAERRPREGREGGKEATVHGLPRGDGDDGGGGRSGGRRRRGSG